MTTFDRHIAAIDVESTGTKPESDRVIEVAVVRRGQSGGRASFRWLVNPQRPIPRESTDVHHITDDDVVGAPSFAMVCSEIAETISGCDLTGFNLRAFDIPILRAEFSRAGVAWPCEGARIIDTFVIFREHEPRNLSAAVRLYCERDHHGAHAALSDAEAALDVLDGQLARYPDLAAMTVADLDVASGGRRPDWATEAGHIRWNAAGDAVVAFGRHSGSLLASMDYGFLGWVCRQDFPEDVKRMMRAVLRGEDPPRAPWAPAPPASPEKTDDPQIDDIPF